MLTIGVGDVWGEGTESFENLASATSYASRSWTGDNGQSSWAATNARTDQKISGNRGLCFKASTASTITMKLTNAQKTAGIGVLSFKYKFPYSDTGKSRVLSITIGSDAYSSGTLSYGTSASYDGSITINSALTSNTVTINVNNGGARICVDDFSWTSNSAPSCSASPTVGNAANNGALVYSTSPMTVPVTCPSIGAGSSCEIKDYGFVWKAGGNPTIANNKTPIGTDNHSTAFSGNISGTFTAGTTYYVKAYAINNGDNTTLSTGTYSFTPRSITFNSNGGSSVATILVLSGTAASEPTAPTKDGYIFGGWYTDSGLGTAVNWSSTITSNKTYYAKWEALPTYTVSFETGTGNPTQADITETVAGAGITLPAGPTPACSSAGWSFAGWGYKSCDETTDEPYLYFPGNTYYPVDDEILYAVYVQGETSTTTYKLLSEGAQIAPDANYIITATAVDKAIKSEVYSSYYIEATDVTVTEDENGYYIANPNSELIWNMGKTGSTISLYNASDNNYLKIYETSGHHNLALDASKHTFTLSEVRDPGYASTFKMESTNDPGYYVLYSTSNTDFTATNNDDLEDTELYLYKQMHSGTYNSNPICCDNEVTLAHNSPTNGTVSFAPAGPIETCDGTVNTTMTITPAAGYTLTAFNYSTGAGTVSPTNQSPSAPSTTANSATPQVITLTFAQNANGTCTANATFSAIAPTAWSWTYNSAAIPNPINLYIGQTAALVATYTPAGNLLLNAEKNYDVVKSDGLTQVSKTYAVEHPTYTFRADAVMDDGTIVLTNHNHTSLTTTVHVHVNPLPKVSFIDIVHSYEFADVVGTIEDNVLDADKTTPTHAEYSGTGANTCETEHTRLVGWIEKTWADDHPNATHEDIIAAGTGVFIEANAAINVLTYNGKTYYAVWAKLQ